MTLRSALVLLALWLPQHVQAATCREDVFNGVEYAVCEVDLTRDMLRLFLYDPATERPYGYFGTLDAALEAQGYGLGFAANAGRDHDDRSPVGR